MSRTISRFSSRVVRRASSTWRSCDLATSVITGAPDSSSALTCGSSEALPPARRVAPKATSSACLKSISCWARAKNSVSRGLAPGQPPSMKPTPKSSRCRAMVSLSATVRLMPSRCAPSRSVVSKTWKLSSVAVGLGGHADLTPVGWMSVYRNDRLHSSPIIARAPVPAEVGRKTKKPLAGARGLRAGLGHGGRSVRGGTGRSLRTGAPAANNHDEQGHGGSLAQHRLRAVGRLRMRA